MKVHLAKPADRGEPVAYVNAFGSLVIRMFEATEKAFKNPSVLLATDADHAGRIASVWPEWRPDNPHNQAVFYHGDTITITF